MSGEVVVHEGLLVEEELAGVVCVDNVQNVLEVPLHDVVGLEHEDAGIERVHVLRQIRTYLLDACMYVCMYVNRYVM